MADVLTLGGVTFDPFSTPSAMGAGGKQAMVVHKLPGGNRVVDTLGPDEDNIAWSGLYYNDNANAQLQALDGMRAAGAVLELSFAGQFRSVIIDSFRYHWRRFPVWAEYEISCLVYQNPSLGSLVATTGGIESLILGDISFAVSIL